MKTVKIRLSREERGDNYKWSQDTQVHNIKINGCVLNLKTP